MQANTQRTRHVGRLVARSLFAIATSLVVGVDAAHATHERASIIGWEAAGGNSVDFEVQSGWRRSGYTPCNNPASPTLASKPCTGPGGLPGPTDVIVETIGNTRLNFGDGNDVGSPGPGGGLAYTVTSIDAANDWLFAEALNPSSLPAIDETISHTYSSSTSVTAFIQSCCRISASSGINRHINNPDGNYRIETTVNPGGGNSPPTSSMPPIVLCPQSGVCAFTVPAADPDHDTITFRMSTDAEAAGPGNNFNQPGESDPSPLATINPTTGLYSWNTTGATLGPSGTNTYYSTQVTIEDRDGSNNVKSKIAVDFLIQLVPQAGVPPVFSQPVCGSTINVNPNNPVSFTVQASDADFGQTVTLNVAGLPVGATMTPGLPTTGNPVSSNFSWTPTVAGAGPHVVNFTATDNAMQQSACAVTITVATCQNDADCSDGNLCTTDVCNPGDPSATVGGCVYPAVQCGACQTCDSGLGCTGAVCTPTDTATATVTKTATETPTAPPTPVDTATATPVDTPTVTETPTTQPSATPANTPTATETSTTQPSATPTSTPPAQTGSLCAPTPLSGCRLSGKSLLVLKNNSNDGKDKLIWKWLRGPETALSELGDPIGGTVYRLCLYTGSGATSVVIPPGTNWKVAGSKGFKFKDKTAAVEGVRKARLKSGAAGKSKILVKGKGLNLPDMVVPMLTLPVTAQLINDANAICYSSTFAEADVRKNDGKSFKARKIGAP